MAMSKYQLAGSLEKKTLTLQEKIKFLDYAEANEKLGWQKLADVFKIGKTAANSILKNKQMLREQYEHFHDKTKKRSRPGKYKVINDILYERYQKCCFSNFYPNGPLMKEEAMEIKINSKIVTLTVLLLQMDDLKSGKQLMQLRKNES